MQNLCGIYAKPLEYLRGTFGTFMRNLWLLVLLAHGCCVRILAAVCLFAVRWWVGKT